MSYSVEQRGRTCSLAEEVSPLDLARNMPGFSAQIPVDICNREFPYHKVISRKLHIGNAPSFSVFAFTTKEFDPSKESLLIIDGGPGGIWNATDAKDVAKMFLAYNTVFFHYRGGGCSALPDSTKELDKTISSINTVADIEGIRSAYQIKRWKSVIGFSYGTNVARMYAHFKPNQMESIVLEGLDQPGRREKARDQSAASSVVQSTNIIDIIKSRYQDSAYLKATISPANFKLFIETTLPQYLAQAPASLNYSLLGFWDTYQKFYVDYYQKQQQPFPRYFNRNTFAMIVALAYASADARSDGAIVFLISQFIDVDIDTVIKTQMNAYVKTLTYTLYPFLDPDYLEIFKT
jgi:pimeloyl-ACP methyl ester carboxylesterase